MIFVNKAFKTDAKKWGIPGSGGWRCQYRQKRERPLCSGQVNRQQGKGKREASKTSEVFNFGLVWPAVAATHSI
jgi:hypothetical protein